MRSSSPLEQVPELKGTWRAEDGSRGTFQGLKAAAGGASVLGDRYRL